MSETTHTIVGTRSEIMVRELEKFDPGSQAVTVGSIEHRMVHEGRLFGITLPFAALASGASLDLLGVVPAGVAPNFRSWALSLSGGPGDVFLYEDAVVSDNGTLLTPLNHNRSSSRTPAMQLYQAPTVTSVGTPIVNQEYVPAASNNQAGLGAAGSFEEWDLAPGKTYLFRYTNNDNGPVDGSASFSFYEPPEVITS